MSDTQKGESRVQLVWAKPIGRHEFRSLRKKLNVSATAFGRKLGAEIGRKAFSRSYIKHIEGGSMHAAPPIAEAFRRLQAKTRGLRDPKPVQQPRILVSRFNVPQEVRALIRPRKCRGHQRYHYFKTTTQVWCDPKSECKRAWRRRTRHQKTKEVRSKHTCPDGQCQGSSVRGSTSKSKNDQRALRAIHKRKK